MLNKQDLIKKLELASNQLEEHKRDNGDTFTSFTLESISESNELHQVLCKLMQESGLSEDYQYTMLSQAIEILREAIESIESDNFKEDDGNLQDNITSLADGATPIYYYELGKFLASNYSIIDDTIKELGKADSIMSDTMAGYFLTLERFCRDLLTELQEIDEKKQIAELKVTAK